MKKQTFPFMLLIVIMMGLFSGCAKDNETTSSTDRASFVGVWTVTPTKLSYEVTISEDSKSSDGVYLKNFALIGDNYPAAHATVKGTTIVLDANQVIGPGLTVNGTGTLSGNRITWNYTTFDGADLTNVMEIYTRK